MRLFVATPTRGQIHDHYVSCLLHLSAECRRRDIGFAWHPNHESPCSLSRGHCARRFLDDEKATHLLFLDDDLDVAISGVMALLESGHPLSAIVYRKKLGVDVGEHEYCFVARSCEVPDERGFVKLDRVGAGCLLIERSALENIDADHADLRFRRDVGLIPGVFREHYGPGYVGEDYAFCDRARRSGYPVHVLLDARTVHHDGSGQYEGNLADHWEQIRAREETEPRLTGFRTRVVPPELR